MPVTDYLGQCHCGAIGYRYRTDTKPENWSIRACQCGFCRAHDALSASDPNGLVEFNADSPEKLKRYRFGLRTADFLLCKECGVYIGALIETEKGLFGIINTHALLETPKSVAPTEPMFYDSENVGGRVSRREDRWTPAKSSL